MDQFNGVKVFSTTKREERHRLGEEITHWLTENQVKLIDKVVTQSSDSEFHCLTVTLFYQRV